MSIDRRLLIYSHDSFGLGHLRRCRAIAHYLVERYKQLLSDEQQKLIRSECDDLHQQALALTERS